MATIDEVEALVRRVVRQEIDRKFGENTSDAAGLPDIGKARLVHPNDPGTVSTLGHLLFGIDAQVREG